MMMMMKIKNDNCRLGRVCFTLQIVFKFDGNNETEAWSLNAATHATHFIFACRIVDNRIQIAIVVRIFIVQGPVRKREKKNLRGSTAINKIHPVSFLIAGLIYSLPKHCVIKQMQKLIKPTHLTRRSDCVQRTIRLEIGFDVEFRDPADCDQYEVVDEIGSNRSIERRNLATARLVNTSFWSIDTIFTPQESVIDHFSFRFRRHEN